MAGPPTEHPTARLPPDLYGAAAVRELDRRAIQVFGVPGGTLMERAGTAVYRALRVLWPEARRVAVVCGTGNNGGDGYVVARLARTAGLAVRVLQVGDPGRLGGDALATARAAQAAGVPVQPLCPDDGLDADVAVDALFGTGLDRPLAGEWAAVVEAVNGSGLPVLAVDLPSGLHADTGRVLGVAVRAAATVTFLAPKPGLYTGEGPEHCGHALFHGLGVPPGVFEGVPVAARRIEPAALLRWLGPRPRGAHKGRFGHVLVVGGDSGYPGAARLAAEAAARAGAGLVTLATRAQHVPAIIAPRPELMARGVGSAVDLESLLARATVVAIGPGLGRGPWGRSLLEAVVASGLPRVVDADALSLLPPRAPGAERQVLTPHPGEAASLLGITTAGVQADRFEAVKALQARYGGVVVLKGSGSLVAGEDGPVSVCAAGNPGMASGGMGDVLTGVIAGLLAQGLPARQAAESGVWAHAEAADRQTRAGERGLLAGDLLPWLPSLLNGPRPRP